MTVPHPLTKARQRNVACRRERVHQAIPGMTAHVAEISISAVAARASVHRSFIHRHPDLHAAVLAVADPPATGCEPGQATTTVSPRSCWPTPRTCTNTPAASGAA
jgi:hypothetical protein